MIDMNGVCGVADKPRASLTAENQRRCASPRKGYAVHLEILDGAFDEVDCIFKRHRPKRA
jgi:hypothetical protein